MREGAVFQSKPADPRTFAFGGDRGMEKENACVVITSV
jgi:hypothetical protein